MACGHRRCRVKTTCLRKRSYVKCWTLSRPLFHSTVCVGEHFPFFTYYYYSCKTSRQPCHIVHTCMHAMQCIHTHTHTHTNTSTGGGYLVPFEIFCWSETSEDHAIILRHHKWHHPTSGLHHKSHAITSLIIRHRSGPLTLPLQCPPARSASQ